jgi:hypothetical protein
MSSNPDRHKRRREWLPGHHPPRTRLQRAFGGWLFVDQGGYRPSGCLEAEGTASSRKDRSQEQPGCFSGSRLCAHQARSKAQSMARPEAMLALVRVYAVVMWRTLLGCQNSGFPGRTDTANDRGTRRRGWFARDIFRWNNHWICDGGTLGVEAVP